MNVRLAEPAEAESVMRVINAAFNPAEAFFIDGDRIDLPQVRAFQAKGAFLVTGDFGGCVYVELRAERAYFGLLSVDPARQKSGVGKRLISAAEEYARTHGCRHMDIRVVNLRTELPPYYRTLGYAESGTEPFPDDSPTKLPCHFICMSKNLSAADGRR
jgi:GNAT superfamily N-acetyltransferase